MHLTQVKTKNYKNGPRTLRSTAKLRFGLPEVTEALCATQRKY